MPDLVDLVFQVNEINYKEASQAVLDEAIKQNMLYGVLDFIRLHVHSNHSLYLIKLLMNYCRKNFSNDDWCMMIVEFDELLLTIYSGETYDKIYEDVEQFTAKHVFKYFSYKIPRSWYQNNCEIMLRKIDDINYVNNKGDNIAFIYFKDTDADEFLDIMLAKGLNINYTNRYGHSLLYKAIIYKQRNLVKVLLNNNVIVSDKCVKAAKKYKISLVKEDTFPK